MEGRINVHVVTISKGYGKRSESFLEGYGKRSEQLPKDMEEILIFE